MFRVFDLVISFVLLIFLIPVFVFLIFIGFLDSGHPLLFQKRVGKDLRVFTLIKFRTMRIGTPSVATHLISKASVTPYGSILRKTKLDELPQLWNVLVGEMSLVGPRPCLPEQMKLIEEREKLGVFSVRPGITGLSQIRGIDMSTPHILAIVDEKMIRSMSLYNYFKYLILTLLGKGSGDRVRN